MLSCSQSGIDRRSRVHKNAVTLDSAFCAPTTTTVDIHRLLFTSKMDPARRTIRPSIDPSGNKQAGLGMSSIPAPMTIRRPAPNMLRQSFAGPQQFLGAPRTSMYPSSSLNVPPSATKPGPAAFGRTPMRKYVGLSLTRVARQLSTLLFSAVAYATSNNGLLDANPWSLRHQERVIL